MTPDVKLGRVRSVLEDLDYPVTRVDAAQALEDYTLQHPGGEANLGGLASDAMSDAFDTAEDLEAEITNVLPEDALGELGESEGEG